MRAMCLVRGARAPVERSLSHDRMFVCITVWSIIYNKNLADTERCARGVWWKRDGCVFFACPQLVSVLVSVKYAMLHSKHDLIA